MSGGWRSSRGFTLMELLVAMTLLGILMTALFGSLRLGTRVWEASDRVLKSEGQVMPIRSFLKDRLEQTMPVVLLLQDGEREIVFAGEPSALRLASTMSESVGFGPYIIEFLPTPGDKGSDLSIRWRLVAGVDDDESDEGGAIGRRVLIQDVETVSLGYFGVKEAEAVATWHGTWQGEEHLPDLIRIELGFEPGSERRWPPLIVSPKVDAW